MVQGFKRGNKFIPTGRSSSAVHSSDIIGSTKPKGKLSTPNDIARFLHQKNKELDQKSTENFNKFKDKHQCAKCGMISGFGRKCRCELEGGKFQSRLKS